MLFLFVKMSETSLDMFYAQSVDFAQKLAASQPKKFYVGFAIQRIMIRVPTFIEFSESKIVIYYLDVWF